ncbi:hypothetical protein BDV18DRAFT_143327 [Aspergillus unguis]
MHISVPLPPLILQSLLMPCSIMKRSLMKSPKPRDRMTKRQKANDTADKRLSEVLKSKPEESEHSDFSILRWCWEEEDDKAPLEQQVKWLKDRNHELEVYLRNSIRMSNFLHLDWGSIETYNYTGQFKLVFYGTWNWGQNWGLRDASSLSPEQKQEIITYLDGYIVQEDFDSIYSRLRPDDQRDFGHFLTEAFLNKTVLDTFFRHPFWYVEEDVHFDDGNDNVVWDDPDSSLFGKKLETLHSQFSHVYSEYAQVWKAITTRLCNCTRPILARPVDMSFGEAMKARRDAKSEALATELLRNETFLSLLKPTEEPDKRLDNLAFLLPRIAQAAVTVMSQPPDLKFQTLKNRDASFLTAPETTSAAKIRAKSDPSEDEGRLLAIAHPYLFTTMNHTEENWEIIEPVYKAVAIFEDKNSPTVVEESRNKSKGTDKGKQVKKPKA